MFGNYRNVMTRVATDSFSTNHSSMIGRRQMQIATSDMCCYV
jgi:hypothetical protein